MSTWAAIQNNLLIRKLKGLRSKVSNTKVPKIEAEIKKLEEDNKLKELGLD